VTEAAQPQVALWAGFGDVPGQPYPIELHGYDLDDTHPDRLGVTLYWRAQRPVDVDYTVFVHLLDGSDEMRGQGDSRPLNGTYPTNVWPVGAIVRDVHTVPIEGDAPLGEWTLAVGLYELSTMTRLPAYDAQGEAWRDRQVMLERAQ
jgi:hypothetical protein